MKTPEQLKGAIRNISKEKDLHAQEVLQVFMFERMEPIREDDDYNNFRVHVIAEYGKIKNKMKSTLLPVMKSLLPLSSIRSIPYSMKRI